MTDVMIAGTTVVMMIAEITVMTAAAVMIAGMIVATTDNQISNT